MRNLIIIYIFCTAILSAQSGIHNYLFTFNLGNMTTFEGELLTINSLRAYPMHNKTGPGLNIGYVKGQTEYCEGHAYHERLIFIQPQVYMQGKYFGVVPGLIVFNILESCDGPDGIALPTLSVRFGYLSKLYFSIDALHDIYFGLLSYNIHLLLFDNFSEINLGLIKSDFNESDGFCYSAQFCIYSNFYLGIRGVYSFENELFGTQMILGIAL